MASKSVGKCALCGRDEVVLTEHHLVPKEKGGTFMSTAMLCIPCHKQIHALYTNDELAVRLNTVEALRADEKLAKYVKWIRKQPAARLVRTKKANSRKRR